MNKCSLLLFETGLNVKIPHFNEVSASIFPIWGNYTFLDFFLSQFNDNLINAKYLFLEENHRAIQSPVQSRYKDGKLKIVTSTYPLNDILDLLEFDESSLLLIATLSNVFLMQTNEINEFIIKAPNQILKFSMSQVPLELYLLKRKRLIKMLNNYKNRSVWKENFSQFLFDEILHSHFEEIVDLPGKLLFKNNLMDLYKKNLWLKDNQQNTIYRVGLKILSKLDIETENSYINKEGHLKNSVIFTGVDVSGYVENSILFPGVKIKKGAKIINSVIMNNNQIGRNSLIQNALILPYFKDTIIGNNNIEDNVTIGGLSKQVKNLLFPDHINSGLTVIGMNAQIPKGTKIEQGCFLDNNISYSILKNTHSLKKGKSLLFGKAS